MSQDSYKLAEATNQLDPKVVFDPKFEKTTVAKTWQTNSNEEESPTTGGAGNKPIADNTRIDGIMYPIIMMDAHVIPQNFILEFYLTYTTFSPTLRLAITKYDGLSLNTPGMVNKVTVIMVPPADGTYKKISMDFYIDSRSDFDTFIQLSCSLFYPALRKTYTKAIKENGNSKLSTYSLFETIAKETQFGFAATENCKNIADNKTRLAINQNYEDMLVSHLQFSGLDDMSFFDAWIDLYGYIVICNLSWIFNKSVAINELSMKMLEGLNLPDGESFDEDTNPIDYGEEDTFRTYTNYKQTPTKAHNKIKSYFWDIRNYSIKNQGTDNTYYIFNHLVNGSGENNIFEEKLTIDEDTTDGKNYKDAYTFQTNEFLGTEMGNESDGNTPVLFQEKRREMFFAKMKAKRLVVELEEINYNIERGMLINLNIFEYERNAKQSMINNIANISENGDTETEADPLDIEEDDPDTTLTAIINNDQFGIPNFELSGIFYVDGMEFEYTGGDTIKQTLYLVKQGGTRNSYLNHSSLAKVLNIETD